MKKKTNNTAHNAKKQKQMTLKKVLSLGIILLIAGMAIYTGNSLLFQGKLPPLQAVKNTSVKAVKTVPEVKQAEYKPKTHIEIGPDGKVHIIDNETGEEVQGGTSSQNSSNSNSSTSDDINSFGCEHGHKEGDKTYYNYCVGTDYTITKLYHYNKEIEGPTGKRCNVYDKMSTSIPNWDEVRTLNANFPPILTVYPKLQSDLLFDGYIIYKLVGGQDGEERPITEDRTYLTATAYFYDGTQKEVKITAFDSGYFVIGDVPYTYAVAPTCDSSKSATVQGTGLVGNATEFNEIKNIKHIQIPLKSNNFLIYKYPQMTGLGQYAQLAVEKGNNGSAKPYTCSKFYSSNSPWENCN